MKPPAFQYVAPTTLEEALDARAEHADDCAILAGGQSLMPLLNLRMAFPGTVIDLAGVSELAGIRECDGGVAIGAMTRQAALESSAAAQRWPLLAQAEVHVGHAAIRNRGTVGGSVAHADPAAELPVALLAMDARFMLRRAGGERTVEAADMFRGAMTTAITEDELLVEVEVPPLPAGARTAFVEHARTHGDFAVAGAAVVLVPGEHAAVALLGAGPRPVRAAAAERALRAGAGAADAAMLAAADVGDDYRRALLVTLTRRALEAVGA